MHTLNTAVKYGAKVVLDIRNRSSLYNVPLSSFLLKSKYTTELKSDGKRTINTLKRSYGNLGFAGFKYILQDARLEDSQAEILSCYIEESLKDLKKQSEVIFETKKNLQEIVTQLEKELSELETVLDELRYNDTALIKKEVESLNNKISTVETSNNELLDTFDHYASLEFNEHVNLRKEDVNTLNQFSEKKQMYYTNVLNRLRVAAEKDKLEVAPQIIWAVTTILIAISISYTLFPSPDAKKQQTK